jgi:hypothetical protein
MRAETASWRFGPSKGFGAAPRDRRLTELLERWRHESKVHDSYVERPAEHFRSVRGHQQMIGDRVARVLEAEYQRIGRTLNSYPSETLTVILYTNREFQDITRSPSWAAGRMTAGFASPWRRARGARSGSRRHA